MLLYLFWPWCLANSPWRLYTWVQQHWLQIEHQCQPYQLWQTGQGQSESGDLISIAKTSEIWLTALLISEIKESGISQYLTSSTSTWKCSGCSVTIACLVRVLDRTSSRRTSMKMGCWNGSVRSRSFCRARWKNSKLKKHKTHQNIPRVYEGHILQEGLGSLIAVRTL